MKRCLVLICAMFLIFGLAGTAPAMELYVDSAPNVHGSSDWAPWWTQTKADVASVGIDNMRTGSFPGQLKADPYDEIVYSTMDLGKRLHWIYWLPGETTAGLDGLFEVKWTIDWGGDDWTYSGGTWAADAPEVGWSQPAHWEDYSGGVIGSFGFAWWSADDDAPPFNTNSNLYDEVDQADIDALRAVVLSNQTFALGQIRFRTSTSEAWQYESLNVDIEPVPEPATMLLLGTGLIGLAGLRRKKFKI